MNANTFDVNRALNLLSLYSVLLFASVDDFDIHLHRSLHLNRGVGELRMKQIALT